MPINTQNSEISKDRATKSNEYINNIIDPDIHNLYESYQNTSEFIKFLIPRALKEAINAYEASLNALKTDVQETASQEDIITVQKNVLTTLNNTGGFFKWFFANIRLFNITSSISSLMEKDGISSPNVQLHAEDIQTHQEDVQTEQLDQESTQIHQEAVQPDPEDAQIEQEAVQHHQEDVQTVQAHQENAQLHQDAQSVQTQNKSTIRELLEKALLSPRQTRDKNQGNRVDDKVYISKNLEEIAQMYEQLENMQFFTNIDEDNDDYNDNRDKFI